MKSLSDIQKEGRENFEKTFEIPSDNAAGVFSFLDTFAAKVAVETRKALIAKVDNITEEFGHDPALALSIIGENFHGGKEVEY